jgi:hypothetical protein
MIILLSSPSALEQAKNEFQPLVTAFSNARAAGNPTALVSNHGRPNWFAQSFNGTGVQFIREIGRQNGQIIRRNAEHFGINAYDTVVLVASDTDLKMGKNGGAVLVAGDWSEDRGVQALGIKISSARQLEEVIHLTSGWQGHWWFSGDEELYAVRALANMSGRNVTLAQEHFARKVTDTAKNGGRGLNALLTVAARSLLMDGVGRLPNLLFAVYPSSNSQNNDTEVLSDFSHRLRTTVSRVKFAVRGESIFIRHTPSPKRSKGQIRDRRDPASQVETIHLNPYYRDKIHGRNVIVIDDCTTYGMSFGVASAFLHKAGAKSVTGVALGKFGNVLEYHKIHIDSDPFAPVTEGNYRLAAQRTFRGQTDGDAQQSLLTLIP